MNGLVRLLDDNTRSLVVFGALTVVTLLVSPTAAKMLRTTGRLTAAVGIVLSAGFVKFIGEGRLHTYQMALTDRPLMLWMACGFTALAAGTYLVDRHLRRAPDSLNWLLVLSLGAILSLALPANSGSYATEASALASGQGFWPSQADLTFGVLTYDTLPNVLLYVPAAATLVARGTSVRRAVIALSSLSAAVELYQALVTDRASQLMDWSANTVGALLGAIVVHRLVQRSHRRNISADSAPRTTARSAVGDY